MFTYKRLNKKGNCFEAHLDVDKYTHNTMKKILPEMKRLAEENDYPEIWTYMPKKKQRIAEHFGFHLTCNSWTKDGLFAVMLLETKLCFQNK